MGLVVQDSLIILGEDGRHEIQLCFGDITKLPIEDKVDIIMLSAFPNDYSPVPGTVISALKRQLDIDVRQLSRNKAEDLRQDFHCWLSEPLPETAPYRRLLCFEQHLGHIIQNFENPVNLVGDLFRAFTSAIGLDGDISVISPLLATGCQGFSPRKMLKAMVTSCAAWMKVGMPLKVLKLIIYVSNTNLPHTSENLDIIDNFNQCKSLIGAESATDYKMTKDIDAYLIYSDIDMGKVKSFIDTMKQENDQIKLLLKEHETLKKNNDEELEKENFQFSKNKLKHKVSTIPAWVEETKKIMLSSKKVVSFLSPHFLSNKDCIDSYNLAMCLSRKHRDNLLAPVYLETMPYVPTYLTLTQWIDCRKKERDPPDMNKVLIGACHLLELLSSFALDGEMYFTSATNSKYDIFISYSHRDEKRVKKFYDTFVNERSDLRVFFDRAELKAGISWQATLYSALNNSSVIICFLSNTYASSTICREEFSIALSQYQCDSFTCRTVSVLLEDWSETKVDPMFSACPCLNIHDRDDSISAKHLLKYVSNCLEKPKSGPLSLYGALKAKREKFIRDTWDVNPDNGHLNLKLTLSDEDCDKNESPIICIVICHTQDRPMGELFVRLINHLSKKSGDARGWTASLITVDNTANMGKLESANVMIPLLSSAFCVSSDSFNLLQVAIGCARNGSCHLVPFILSHLPNNPSFIHLLVTMFNSTDPIWRRLGNSINDNDIYPFNFENSNKSLRQWHMENIVSLRMQLSMRIAVDWIMYISKKHSNNSFPILLSLDTIREFGFLESPENCQFDPKFINIHTEESFSAELIEDVDVEDKDIREHNSGYDNRNGDQRNDCNDDQVAEMPCTRLQKPLNEKNLILTEQENSPSKPIIQFRGSKLEKTGDSATPDAEFSSNSKVHGRREETNERTKLCNFI